ncbi:hypothetical protein SNEBB_009142 [Seison nebaliae]|nr:hypothetical protein SNEBB_009142 [Seison nebaliae]
MQLPADYYIEKYWYYIHTFCKNIKGPNVTLEEKLQKMKDHIRALFDILSRDDPGEEYLNLLAEINYLVSELNRTSWD